MNSNIQDGAKRDEIIKKITAVIWRSEDDDPDLAKQIYDEVVLPEILEATTGLANAFKEGMQEIWWGDK